MSASGTGAGGVDFSRLYSELGIEPGCGLPAFKRAYRRRVAALHPDRPGAAGRDAGALIALNLGYAAALDFLREHGRLPGAPAAVARPAVRVTAVAITVPERAQPPLRRGPGTRMLLLPVLLLVAAIWRWLPTFEPAPAPGAGTQAPVARDAPRTRARLGMDRDTVTLILGPPVARDHADSHWVYGASWLRFHCGRLAEWYSSPLQPLRVEPLPAAGARPAEPVEPHRPACPYDDAPARALAAHPQAGR